MDRPAHKSRCRGTSTQNMTRVGENMHVGLTICAAVGSLFLATPTASWDISAFQAWLQPGPQPPPCCSSLAFRPSALLGSSVAKFRVGAPSRLQMSASRAEHNPALDEDTPSFKSDLVGSLRRLRNSIDAAGEGSGDPDRPGKVGEELQFEPSLSARERALLHEACERLGLGHMSDGKGESRALRAWALAPGARMKELERALRVEAKAAQERWEERLRDATPAEMEAGGLLLRDAILESTGVTNFGRTRWVLEQDPSRPGHMGAFSARPGAPVALAQRDKADAYTALKGAPIGYVAEARRERIVVVFPGSDALDEAGAEGQSASLVACPDAVTTERLLLGLRACRALLEAESSPLSFLLGPSALPPTADRAPAPPQAGALFNPSLNDRQREAVALCCAEGGADVALVHGPFGTGKTTTLVEVVRQRVRLGQRVLVCAPSNAAVDNLAAALLASDPGLALARAGIPERVDARVQDATLEALQRRQPGAELVKRLYKEASEALRKGDKWRRAADGGAVRREAKREGRALLKDARAMEAQTAQAALRKASVLCGTLTGFASALRDAGDDAEASQFDVVVIDEASQATTPAVLLTLPHIRASASRRPCVILAGDHRQLPPTVLTTDRVASAALQATLFEELMERDGGGVGGCGPLDSKKMPDIPAAAAAVLAGTATVGSAAAAVGRISVALTDQYRMPPPLMAFPAAAFYGSALAARGEPQLSGDSAVPRSDEAELLLRGECLFELIDTAGAGFEEEVGGSQRGGEGDRGSRLLQEYSTLNRQQAKLTARVAAELVETWGVHPGDVGVVTPYNAHAALLRDELRAIAAAGGAAWAEEVEVATVDGFQGREKTAIVLDAVRSNADAEVGFLADYRRLNVGLTRARSKLVVVADSATLGADPLWDALFTFAAAQGSGGDAPRETAAGRSVYLLPVTDLFG